MLSFCITTFVTNIKNHVYNYMKKSVALLMFGLMTMTVVLSACGNKKKANCEAYRAYDQTIEQESDLASR